MLVMITRRVPRSLRGELSRWLTEPATGVFLGNPSARVRDELWNKATEKARDGEVIQVWSAPTPQGFAWRQIGAADRRFRDFEDLVLIAVRKTHG